MRTRRIAWTGVRVPFAQPYVTTAGSATHRYSLLIRIDTSDGVEGLGEAAPVGPGSEGEVRALERMLAEAAPALAGRDLPVGDPASWCSGIPMVPELRFGIETAAYDAVGKATRRSLVSLLGGSPRALALNATIAADTPGRAVQEASLALAQGFETLKLKVGMGSDADVALVSAVRVAVGEAVRLRLDANGAWSVDEAVASLARLAPYDLEYVEQPTTAVEDLRAVHAISPVALAADESLSSEEDAHTLVAAGAAGIWVVKAARIGSLRTCLRIAEVARSAGVRVVVTSSLETGVGLAAGAHLASVIGTPALAHGLATGMLLESDLLVVGPAHAGGVMKAPTGPGLGVALDLEALRRYAMFEGGTGA